MTTILTGYTPETIDVSAPLPWRSIGTMVRWEHPQEKPTFRARARNAARRSGIFGLDKPHIWKADGRWSRTRCQDVQGLGLNDAAMAHRDRLAEADRCPV